MKSIGGFQIGHSILEHQDFLSSMLFNGKCKLSPSRHLGCSSFELLGHGLKVSFNVFTRKITHVESFFPYKGEVIGTGIHLGMKVRDLLNKHLESWDGDDNYLWNLNYPGLFFGFLEDGQEFLMVDIELYYDLKVNTIGLVSPSQNNEYDRYGKDWFEKKEGLIAFWKHIADQRDNY